MKQVYIRCDSGFIATIRECYSLSELQALHINDGLQQPYYHGGDASLFFNLCAVVVALIH